MHWSFLLPKPSELHKWACIFAKPFPHLMQDVALLPKLQLLQRKAIIFEKEDPHLMHFDELFPNPQLLHSNAGFLDILI